jgi:hypothetical protein
MKYLITESQKHSLLKQTVKENGFALASKMVGQDYLVHEVFNNDYNEFLSLYDDLEIHESEENPKLFLYRYRESNNIIVYDARDEDDEYGNYLYFNQDYIFGALALFSDIHSYRETLKVLKSWVRETYGINIRESNIDSFYPNSEDYGFFATLR